MTSLELGGNNLHHKTAAELAQVLAALPANVTSLDMSGNNFHKKTGAELAQVFSALPVNVTSLNLRGNYLHDKTAAELAQVLAALPAKVQSVILSNRTINMSEFRAEQLIQPTQFNETPAKASDSGFFATKPSDEDNQNKATEIAPMNSKN